MKFLLLLSAITSLKLIDAQVWQTIPESGNYGRAAYEQFIIDPYTNNIWLNSEDQVSVIETDGAIRIFTSASGEMGSLYIGNNLRLGFTPGHTYYAVESVGLLSFDNYISTQKHGFLDFNGVVRYDGDTIWVTEVRIGGNDNWLVFTEAQSSIEGKAAKYMVSKNGIEFASSGSPFFYGLVPSDKTYLHDDSDYLWSAANEMKFTRLSDTLYVAQELGISRVYNYDVFDTLTPYNTTNMPSANVLEMEFDEADTLWAVFGNQNGEPFAIAKLNGNNWESIFNVNNSPIDFATFMGLEIDNLGNLWVNDEDGLHTLITSNSPNWLQLDEHHRQVFSIYPNPTTGQINIKLDEHIHFNDIGIFNLSGQEVYRTIYKSHLNVSLQPGVYFVKLFTENAIVGVERIIVK